MGDLLLDMWVGGNVKTKGSMDARFQQTVVGSTQWARMIRDGVRQARMDGWTGRADKGVPVRVRCLFFLPADPLVDVMEVKTRSGDLDKLERNVLDALTDDPKKGYVGLFPDDVQVVSLSSERVYAYTGRPHGLCVKVWRLDVEDVHAVRAAADMEAQGVMRRVGAIQ